MRDSFSNIKVDDVIAQYKDTEILRNMWLINSCFHRDSGNKKIKSLMAGALRNHMRGVLTDTQVVSKYRETLENHVSFQGMA